MWLHIFWLVPSISYFGINMPKSFTNKIENLWKPKYSPIVWALTFFLPCGFTQSIQILAVSSWSFVSWWLVMLFFALWTFPVLFLIWFWTSLVNSKNTLILNKIIAGILIVFWITILSNSYRLINFSNPWKVVAWNNIQSSNNDVEIIRAWHNWFKMEPKEILLEKWKNYKIIITPSSDWKGCMFNQRIPKLNTKISDIKAWVDIIYEINNAEVGTYEVVCGTMGMLQWKIIVK
jgi:hypothetical protein